MHGGRFVMTNKGPFMRSGLGLTVQNRRSDFRVSGKDVSRLPAMMQPANLIKKTHTNRTQKPSSVSLLSFMSFALSVTYTFHVRRKRSTVPGHHSNSLCLQSDKSTM